MSVFNKVASILTKEIAAVVAEKFGLDVDEVTEVVAGALQVKVKKGKKGKQTGPKPLKRLSTYIIYCNETREATKKANADVDGQEIMKLLAHNWGELSEKEKVKWAKKADKVNAEREAKNIEAGFEAWDKKGEKKIIQNQDCRDQDCQR